MRNAQEGAGATKGCADPANDASRGGASAPNAHGHNGDSDRGRGPWLPDGDTVLLGQLALALAAHFPEWVRRRTTTVCFLDDLTVSQRLTVSMRLPSAQWFSDHAPGIDLRDGLPRRIYVPLNIVTKGALAAFRIADADDRTVSMLNRVERCELAVKGFQRLLERKARARGCDNGLNDWLERVIAAHERERGKEALDPVPHASESGRQHGSADGNGGLREQQASIGACDGVTGRYFDLLFTADDPYGTLLAYLAGGFLILVPVEYKEDGPNEHLFTLTWEAMRASHPLTVGGSTKAVMASLGLWPKELMIDDFNVGWAQSTHFVIEEPQGSHNLRTAVTWMTKPAGQVEGDPGARAEGDPGARAEDDPGARENGCVVRRWLRSRLPAGAHAGESAKQDGEQSGSRKVWGRPHADLTVHLKERSEDGVEYRLAFDATARVSVLLAPRRSGVFAAVTASAVLSAVLLWVMYAHLDTINVAAGTAVTAFLPVVLAAWLIRQGEHAIAGALLAGVRICGLVALVLVIGATVAMVVADGRERPPQWLMVCATVARPAPLWGAQRWGWPLAGRWFAHPRVMTRRS